MTEKLSHPPPSAHAPMQIWGLTGGIASGKSSVAQLFAARGVPIVDADALYHRLIAPKDGVPSALAQQIGQLFAGSLQADHTLNRRLVAEQIFAEPGARARLEAITHPAIARAADQAFAQFAKDKHPRALYDVPLLFERDLRARFVGTIVVWVPRTVQMQRLQARDGLSLADAERRLAAQWPLDDKRALATHCIDNAGTRQHTVAQVEALLRAWQTT